MNLLVIKANNRPDGVSTKMYETFMESIKDAKNINVTNYDLFNEDMPYLGQELFNAFGKLQNGEQLSEIEDRLLKAKAKAKELLTNADVIVMAFPLWNLTVPAKLHTFIDYITEAGFTFGYAADGSMVQPMKDKKVLILNARGGVYSVPAAASMEMSVNYIHNIFGNMFGMEIINEVVIEGHNADPSKSQEIIERGLEEVRKVGEKLVG